MNEEKTNYPSWITEFAFAIPVETHQNEDGTFTVTHEFTKRTVTADTLNEALNVLNKEINDAVISGNL